MKIYEDYFRTKEHIENEEPETVVWTSVNSTGLAEMMELAEIHGYTHKLECYDENVRIGNDLVECHRRTMVFTRKEE